MTDIGNHQDKFLNNLSILSESSDLNEFTDGDTTLSMKLISLTIIAIISLCLYLESGKLVNSGSIDYNVVADQPNDAVRSDVSIRKLIKLETNEVFGFCFAPAGLVSLVKFSMFQFNSMNIFII